MSDCRPCAAGRDVPAGAEGAAGFPEGGAADRAAGEAGADPGGEAEQEAASVGAAGRHQPPQESAGTCCGHQVGKNVGHTQTHIDIQYVAHIIRIVLSQCRKEERKARLCSQQTVTQDQTVLALRRKLEEKQQERQRLKQSESLKDKTFEQEAPCTIE